MAIVFCSKCRQDIRPEHRLRLGQRFFCPNCCIEIDVVSPRHLEPDWAYDKHELE
jgi:predicted amidophosphoribosyltransferase